MGNLTLAAIKMSNSPGSAPPPPPTLGLNIDRCIIPLFKLGSFYSTNASGAEQLCKCLKQTIKILRIPTIRRQTSWLFCKHGRGFELGTTVTLKSSYRSERDLNSEPPNCKSDSLSTRPRFLQLIADRGGAVLFVISFNKTFTMIGSRCKKYFTK